MKCKLTLNEGKGVKAHIIPKSFYRIDPKQNKLIKLYRNKEGHYPQRAPNGIYDENIVTEDGEKIFQSWDNYGYELLIQRFGEHEKLVQNHKLTGFQIKNYDYKKLKLFFLSILWRVGVSNHKFCSGVILGPYEELLRRRLLDSDPGSSKDLAVLVERWVDSDLYGSFLNPHKEKIDGITFYRLYLANYVVYVKADKRKTPDKMSRVQMTSGRPLLIIGKNYKNSKELSFMAGMVHSSAKRD